jgi:transposase
MQFGRSSEVLNAKIAQLELVLEELEAAEAAEPLPSTGAPVAWEQPVRRALPADLPRDTRLHPALPADQPCT